MVIPRKDLPDIGELVVATVREIFDYGAYVTLDEYNDHKAFLPWSEASTKWVKDLHEVVYEGEKIVVKVIRVDRRKGEVDVSLKRVSDTDKRRKMMWWKRFVRGAKIIEGVAKSMGWSVEEAYRDVVWRLDDYYGDPLTGLEEAVIRGGEALARAGVPEKWIQPLIQEASRHVRIKKVSVKRIIILRSLSSDGIERIKKVLEAVDSEISGSGLASRIYTSGSPRYMVEVEAQDYKSAETVLEKALEKAARKASELGVEFSVESVKS
ncbi:translation initiation factor IF-2 subunit alpha [Thermogladius sp. 4427co]|uniref:translation initiation factor IF-2 subunit alpha n=1 Tax=Thermogladius sp. 4427co TaxID=3450718 RepID=UPI003F79BB78